MFRKSTAQIHGFFLIMMLEQDVQRKAQAEIDAVVGRDRLPEYADRDKLPYVEAIAKEFTRLHTVIPCGTSSGRRYFGFGLTTGA